MDDVDAILQLLSLQEGMEVLQQVRQVSLSVPVRNEDGDPLQGLTFLRVIPASVYFGIFCLHVFQSKIWFENELVLPSYNQNRTQETRVAISSSVDRLTWASTHVRT